MIVAARRADLGTKRQLGEGEVASLVTGIALVLWVLRGYRPDEGKLTLGKQPIPTTDADRVRMSPTTESFGNFEAGADHQTGRASSRALDAAIGTYQEAWLDRTRAR